MTITMEDVRAALDFEEPEYESAAKLGPDALPYLSNLVASQDTILAAKATYLAGRINVEGSADVVAQAARSDDLTVRLAAAGAIRDLSELSATDVLLGLLNDPDQGVRKLALRAVGQQISFEVRERVEEISRMDPVPIIRELAAASLRSTQR